LAGWALWVCVLWTIGVCTAELLESVRLSELVTASRSGDLASNGHLLIGV
jgi:hypothetical protein